MTIEQDFLPYAVGSGANVVTQPAYAALTTLLQNGMSSGIVSSVQLNKILRQPSIIASVVAQLIVANAGQPAIDDGTTATLLANLQTAIAVIARQNPVLTDSGAANVYISANAAAFTAYPSVSGLVIDVAVATPNTGASTLAIDGLAAKPIYGLALQALQGGELIKGVASFIYVVASTVNSGNGAWILMEAPGGAQQIAPATQSSHAVQLGQIQTAIQQNIYSAAQAGGTADALSASFTPAITATTMASGAVEVTVRAAYANLTSAPTFTPNAGVVAAQTIVKGNGLALAAGDIAGAGHWITLQWDVTLAKWVLMNPASGVAVVGLPAGTVIESAAPATPTGYLACPIAQTNLSRTAYASLFAALTVQTTATWTSGSTSLTVASATNVFVGYPISGTGIPTGTTIATISGTTVTISAATTAAGTAAAIVVAPWGVGDGGTTFGMPWFPSDYVSSMASGNLGTQTTGQVISHSHTYSGYAINAAGGSGVGGSSGSATTGNTGGAANLAAGVRMNKFVRY